MIPNQWYPILESKKLGRKPLHVRRCGEDLVLWRRPDGRVVAQADRCPHKGVRLSGGRVVGDQIQCPYHGFRFTADGSCAAAPCIGRTGHIPGGMRVETMSAREAHGLIWYWHGAPDAITPDLPIADELLALPPYAGRMSYDREDVHYTRYIESLLEFYHVPWVHSGAWYNITDDIAVGGLSPKAIKRHRQTAMVVDQVCTTEGQRIDYTFNLANEHDPSAPKFPWKIVFVAPCLVYAENPHFRAAQWSVPIDESSTHIIVTFCGLHNAPLPAFVNKLITEAILVNWRYGQDAQDYRMIRTQTPKVSEVAANTLTAADTLNAAFLKLRRQLKRRAENPLKVIDGDRSAG